MSYALNDRTLFKIEKDTTLTTDTLDYEKAKSNYSVGIDYALNENFVVGFSVERGSTASLKFTYKNNPKTSYQNTNIKIKIRILTMRTNIKI